MKRKGSFKNPLKTLSKYVHTTETPASIGDLIAAKYIENARIMGSTRLDRVTDTEKEAIQDLLPTHSLCHQITVGQVVFSVRDHIAFYDKEDTRCESFNAGEIRVIMSQWFAGQNDCFFLVKQKEIEHIDNLQCWKVKQCLDLKVVKYSQLATHNTLSILNLPSEPTRVIALESEPTLCFQ